MDPSKRTHHLISEILELLRELSYETQRQDQALTELQAKVAALEATGPEPHAPAAEGGSVPDR